MTYAAQHLSETIEVVQGLDPVLLERLVDELAALRERGGRLFFLGVGGSAGNCSHAVNDFRKIAGIECYAPTDNVSELTARTNDEGWGPRCSGNGWRSAAWMPRTPCSCSPWAGAAWSATSARTSSARCSSPSRSARGCSASSGRDGGYTAEVGDVVVIVPTVNPDSGSDHPVAEHTAQRAGGRRPAPCGYPCTQPP